MPEIKVDNGSREKPTFTSGRLSRIGMIPEEEDFEIYSDDDELSIDVPTGSLSDLSTGNIDCSSVNSGNMPINGLMSQNSFTTSDKSSVAIAGSVDDVLSDDDSVFYRSERQKSRPGTPVIKTTDTSKPTTFSCQSSTAVSERKTKQEDGSGSGDTSCKKDVVTENVDCSVYSDSSRNKSCCDTRSSAPKTKENASKDSHTIVSSTRNELRKNNKGLEKKEPEKAKGQLDKVATKSNVRQKRDVFPTNYSSTSSIICGELALQNLVMRMSSTNLCDDQVSLKLGTEDRTTFSESKNVKGKTTNRSVIKDEPKNGLGDDNASSKENVSGKKSSSVQISHGNLRNENGIGEYRNDTSKEVHTTDEHIEEPKDLSENVLTERSNDLNDSVDNVQEKKDSNDVDRRENNFILTENDDKTDTKRDSVNEQTSNKSIGSSRTSDLEETITDNKISSALIDRNSYVENAQESKPDVKDAGGKLVSDAPDFLKCSKLSLDSNVDKSNEDKEPGLTDSEDTVSSNYNSENRDRDADVSSTDGADESAKSPKEDESEEGNETASNSSKTGTDTSSRTDTMENEVKHSTTESVETAVSETSTGSSNCDTKSERSFQTNDETADSDVNIGARQNGDLSKIVNTFESDLQSKEESEVPEDKEEFSKTGKELHCEETIQNDDVNEGEQVSDSLTVKKTDLSNRVERLVGTEQENTHKEFDTDSFHSDDRSNQDIPDKNTSGCKETLSTSIINKKSQGVKRIYPENHPKPSTSIDYYDKGKQCRKIKLPQRQRKRLTPSDEALSESSETGLNTCRPKSVPLHLNRSRDRSKAFGNVRDSKENDIGVLETTITELNFEAKSHEPKGSLEMNACNSEINKKKLLTLHVNSVDKLNNRKHSNRFDRDPGSIAQESRTLRVSRTVAPVNDLESSQAKKTTRLSDCLQTSNKTVSNNHRIDTTVYQRIKAEESMHLLPNVNREGHCQLSQSQNNGRMERQVSDNWKNIQLSLRQNYQENTETSDSKLSIDGQPSKTSGEPRGSGSLRDAYLKRTTGFKSVARAAIVSNTGKRSVEKRTLARKDTYIDVDEMSTTARKSTDFTHCHGSSSAATAKTTESGSKVDTGQRKPNVGENNRKERSRLVKSKVSALINRVNARGVVGLRDLPAAGPQVDTPPLTDTARLHKIRRLLRLPDTGSNQYCGKDNQPGRLKLCDSGTLFMSEHVYNNVSPSLLEITSRMFLLPTGK